MHRKAIWKPGVGEIAKPSREIATGPHKEGLQHPMKNRGQQKCWDKALALYQVCIWLLLLNILPKLRYLVGRNYI